MDYIDKFKEYNDKVYELVKLQRKLIEEWKSYNNSSYYREQKYEDIFSLEFEIGILEDELKGIFEKKEEK